MTNKSTCRLAVLCSLLLLPGLTQAQKLTAEQMLAWPQRDFAGQTQYSLQQHQDGSRLQADCQQAASALYLEQAVDLNATPVLRWSWSVERVFDNLDETSKQGDDYPVRLYVVKDGGLLPWRTRAVNYVWSSQQPVDSAWPNAFTANAMMLALRSGDPQSPGQMIVEQRNVQADFQRLHGIELESIDGIAIMTDCDNSGQSMRGWYGSLEWLPAP